MFYTSIVVHLSIVVPLQARSIEERFVKRWQAAGVQPPPHPLARDPAAAAAFLRHPDNW